VRNTTASPRQSGILSDLAALRRWFWLPLATLAIAVIAALALGALASTKDEARFRATVFVDALPPLFGPAIVPGPVEYARLATSDEVLASVARDTGLTPDALRPRLDAQPRFTRPEIDFKVTGVNALNIARAWQANLNDAAIRQTPAIERQLAEPYQRQLTEAQTRLQALSAAAQAAPGDAAAQQRLKAAEENYETAAKLSQSYDVVASTMNVQLIPSVTPRIESAGVGSTRGRLAAAVAIGLLAGVIGALALDLIARRRTSAHPIDEAPAEMRRVGSSR
jgi:hypothetical protein